MTRPDADTDAAPQGGYPPEAFSRIAALQRGNYWFESRNRLITWAMRRYFPGARSFADIGCGTGYVLGALHETFPHMQLTGTDFLEQGLAFARTQVPSATFLHMNTLELSLPEPVDVAGCFDVLEHIPDDEEAIRRVRGVIRPGGGLLVTVPQHRWLWSSADDQAHHVRRYRRHEMVGRLRSAGFEVLRTTSFVSLLLPLMAASRWRDARKKKGPEATDLVVPAPLNVAFAAALTLERACIKGGASFPAGGSLFVVARRT